MSDSTLDRNKTWLVDKDYTQPYGIDYKGTVATVAKMNIVRILLSQAHYGWELHRFEVRAFLHEDLEEEVYIEILPGYDSTGGGNKVFRLKKVIY